MTDHQEKLNKIKARCQELLAIAGPVPITPLAEAGWRATIAAIDGLALIAEHGQEPERGAARYDLGKILTTWPDELL